MLNAKRDPFIIVKAVVAEAAATARVAAEMRNVNGAQSGTT